MNVIKELGQGGFGIVEKVQDPKGNFFARKTFLISNPGGMNKAMQENVLKRFKREVTAQEQIDHKNIVKVLSSSMDSTPPHYFMPLAESSLEDDIVADKTLVGNYIEAIMDILAGLEEMHELGMVHRDLKPRNILRFKEEIDEVTKYFYAIGDFGFVSVDDSRVSTLTSTDMGIGGDIYFAPEIAESLRKGTPASDIYSVGCILHSMVGSSTRTAMSEIHEGGPFGHIMLVCTRRDPQRRFQTVASLREAILSVSEVDRINAAIANSKNGLVAALAGEGELPLETWSRIESALLADLENAPYVLSPDSKAMLQLLTRDRIKELNLLDQGLFKIISSVFASWAREYRFDYDYCDTLGSRLDYLIELGEVGLKVDCIMALLYLGVDHNRYYVERIFTRHTDPSLDDKIAQRISIEMHKEGKKVCDAIQHLEKYTYFFYRSNMHPLLIKALNSICK